MNLFKKAKRPQTKRFEIKGKWLTILLFLSIFFIVSFMIVLTVKFVKSVSGNFIGFFNWFINLFRKTPLPKPSEAEFVEAGNSILMVVASVVVTIIGAFLLPVSLPIGIVVIGLGLITNLFYIKKASLNSSLPQSQTIKNG